MAQARLVYVMGPSGAGKTRMIDYARSKIDGTVPVVFAHRYITRPPGRDGENYVFLSSREFALRQARGIFALDWQAHGFDYGIGIEIHSWLAAGLTVVVEGSRAHFIGRRANIGHVVPVLVTAGQDELRRRLTMRERESVEAIEERLERAGKFVPADPSLLTIDNSGATERAGEAFASILIKEAAGR